MKHFKYIAILLLVTPVMLSISSCSASQRKDMAYCFSAVFDNKDGVPSVSLYCKIPSSEGEENAKNADTVLSFTGNSFEVTLEKVKMSEYELYFNSLVALFFSDNISKSQLSEIASLLFNNTKYQTSCHVYSPNEEGNYEVDIHETAFKICTEKRLPVNIQMDFTKAIKYFRSNLSKGI